MMADVWRQAWVERLAALVHLPWQLSLDLRLNEEAEHLSCILCEHGHEDHVDPPEWLVSFRSEGALYTKGLHERCRHANRPRPPRTNT